MDKHVHEQQFWNDWVRISENYIRQRFNYVVDENFVPLGHPWPDSFKYMFDLVGDVAGKDVLDCGAGTGWGSIIFARKKAKKVIAIDVSDGMLALLRKLAQINGVKSVIHTQRTAIEDAVFEDQSFDVIFCSDILHHADLEEAMVRIYQWLKPGGIAVFSEPLANSKFLTAIRRLVPVKSIGTDTERGLNLKEIKEQAIKFSEFTFKEFQLFSRLDRVIKNQRVNRALLSFDSWVLKHFPALRYFARIIVFRVRK
jgi:2-polyprenyl-3-methyl-5-hydroxy-6-metoxy-1,4-benzoquinol methylase